MSVIQLISLIVFVLGVGIIPFIDRLFFTKAFNLDHIRNADPKGNEIEMEEPVENSDTLKDKFGKFVDRLADKYESVAKRQDIRHPRTNRRNNN